MSNQLEPVSSPEPIRAWFAGQGWTPLAFQEETWAAYLNGESGLVQVPTGAGKTYAAVLGPVAEMLAAPTKGLKLLYLTPLRAVARDIEAAIRRALGDLAPHLRVESRTGDTKATTKRKQLTDAPDILITTPESLSVLLSYKGSSAFFSSLQGVVLDEWHELLGSKRGTQTELGLTRLRSLRPNVRTWALSATLANPDEAAAVAGGAGRLYRIVKADLQRATRLRSVLPETVGTFPWAGHLGTQMVGPLLEVLNLERSTLIFTNTRRQAERWYQFLAAALPSVGDKLALHHGSVERTVRERIEAGLKSGAVRVVVATSSLDLGVDFQPVETVVQVGSPKSVARLLQRAGRSAHTPGGVSEVLFVPTNALELLEVNALREALRDRVVEPRRPLEKPYDVLAQHLVTLACGDGFTGEVLDEVRGSVAYQGLSDDEFGEVLTFIQHGGRSLRAYPDFHKVVCVDGRYTVASQKLARRHRMTIGTITSDSSVFLKFTNRQKVGSVNEQFVSRLKPGDVFLFGGHKLEFVSMQDMTALVRKSKRPTTVTASFTGEALPLSHLLGAYVLREFERGLVPENRPPEWDALRPVLETQARLSKLPSSNELLLELVDTREGRHLFLYPFEGRSVHEGLAALLALRLTRLESSTLSFAVDEYGLEILAPKGYPFEHLLTPDLLDLDNLEADLTEAVNLSELARRQFRGVAQVAGLVFTGYPGARKTNRQLQVSTATLYNVFKEFEPHHLLLRQAEREVLARLEMDRLTTTAARLQTLPWTWTTPRRPTPLGFPLVVTRLRANLSSETLAARLERMMKQWSSV